MKTKIFNVRNLLITGSTTILLLFMVLTDIFAQDHIRPKVTVFNNIEVNTFNGNLIYTRQDMLVKGNMPINIAFYYNSVNDTVDFGYGLGWYFNYGLHYYFDSANNFVLIRNGGQEDVYTHSGNQYLPPVGIYDYLLEYEPAKFKLTTKDGTKYFFANASHKKLTSITDLNGNSIDLTYDQGFPVTISNSSGRSVTFSWNGNHLTEVVNDGATFNYEYTDNHLSQVTNPEGFSETYQYLASGKLKAIADYNGNPVYIEYTSGVLVNKVKSCASEMSFSFVENKSFVIENGSNGKLITNYSYDDQGRIVQIINPEQNSIYYEYDNNNNVTKFTDFKGNVYHLTYDANGNMLSASDPASLTFQLAYNQLNRITSAVDQKGNTTNVSYDDKGNLLSINQPLNVSSSFLYDEEGNITQLTDPRGNATGLIWDDNHNLTQISFPIGSVSLSYNSSGKITEFADANGNHVYLEYAGCTTCGLVSKVKINDTISTSYTYDGNKNLKTETDANGNLKTYGYDELNRLNSVTIPAGTANYQYDQQSNLTLVTDANNHSTQYAYNETNQLASETDAIGKTATYEYDANGNLIQETDANGNTITYTYNSINQLVQRNYPGNTDNFTYDELGNLTNVYNNDISMSYTYDALSRLTSKTIDNWNKTIVYTYDEADNRTTMTDPDGGITYYTYDANNRLTVLENPFGEITLFEYDLGGRITRQTNANGTYAEYSYTDWDWLLTLANKKSNGEIISKYDYTYDSYGNRLTMTVNDTAVHYYTYDVSHRLTQAVYPWGETESFTYNGGGNRLTRTLNGMTTNYTYNAADQLLTAGDATFTFDSNGNMTSKTENGQTTTFFYNALNRLVKIIYPDGTENTFVNDPFGNRISWTNKAGQTTRYFLDEDNVLMELNNSGTTMAHYTSSLYVDSWLSIHRDSMSYMFHKDGLNSTVGLTDASQSMAATYNYNAFGEVENETGNLENHFTFTGREYDIESGYYYYRSRYYCPQISRFLVRDFFTGLVTIPESLNNYCYVQNNPTNYTDPMGLYAMICRARIQLGETGPRLPNWAYWYIVSRTVFGIPLYPILYLMNLLPSHQHIYFFNEDGTPKNVSHPGLNGWNEDGTPRSFNNYGYGNKPGGLFTDEDFKNIIECDPIEYDEDEILDDMVEIEPNYRDKKYSFPFKICHSYTGDVRGKYLYDLFLVNVLRPIDPNEILGPTGYDTIQWVSVNKNLSYTVLFENDPDFATAPAQNVLVKLPVTENLNMYDFRLNSFGFGSFIFTVPQNTAAYSTRLDVRDSLGLFVDITAGLNVNTHEAFWLFESIDPGTGLTPTDPQSGFLPVNDSLLSNGEGFVTFTIKPKSTCQTGDSLLAKASIVFDENAPIETNTWFNVVDALPPTTIMDSIPAITNQEIIPLSWQSQDDPGGVGVNHFDLYVSKDGDAFYEHKSGIDSSYYEFHGSENSNYAFFMRATDFVGNQEPLKYSSNDTIQIVFPNADFVASATLGASPLTVLFTDLSTGLINSWVWDFNNDGIVDSQEQNPTWTYFEPGIYTVSLTISDGLRNDTEIKTDYIRSVQVDNQMISLNQGYQMVSSRITPLFSDFSEVIGGNLSNLIYVRNSEGKSFVKIGENWVNNIGHWMTKEGYLFKMNNSDDLLISGETLDPQTPIGLSTGYQMISYLPDQPMDAIECFEGVMENVEFVRNTNGKMLIKLGNNLVNGIGDLQPGEGYLAKMNNPDVMTYPLDAGYKDNSFKNKKTSHFKVIYGDPLSEVWTIFVQAIGLETNDEIAVFDGDQITGASVIISEETFDNSIPVFGNLFKTGNTPTIKYWIKSQNKEYELTDYSFINPYGDAYDTKEFPQGDNKYSVIFTPITGITESAGAVPEIYIFPNPTTGKINITIPSAIYNMSITIFDIEGNSFDQFKNENSDGFYEKVIDLKELKPGVYYIGFITSDFKQVKKIIKF